MGFLAFVDALRKWAERQDDIRGVAVVGSYARGTAGPGSDVDVIVLTTDRARYLEERGWLHDFGGVLAWRYEDWGALTSVRAFFDDGAEVEFGIAALEWAAVPVDAGTVTVMTGGVLTVFERDGLLSALLAAAPAAAELSEPAADARCGGLG